jgi:hypothetical protein
MAFHTWRYVLREAGLAKGRVCSREQTTSPRQILGVIQEKATATIHTRTERVEDVWSPSQNLIFNLRKVPSVVSSLPDRQLLYMNSWHPLTPSSSTP